MNKGYTVQNEGMRGTTVTQQFPRDNDDGITDERESRVGHELEGDIGNISPMIKNGKVPTD